MLADNVLIRQILSLYAFLFFQKKVLKTVMIIAIDGPAGAGKSTIARKLARDLNIAYIDSGAMYRTLTLFAVGQFGESEVESSVGKVTEYFEANPHELKVEWEGETQRMFLGEKDVTGLIRSPEITSKIKYIATHAGCRAVVDKKMRSLSVHNSFVVDGRDIGTYVFPDARNKFYLDASAQIRAERRALESNIPLTGESFEKLKQEIIDRDRGDMEREIAPLKRADDATYIDTSDMNIDEVVDKVRSYLTDWR